MSKILDVDSIYGEVHGKDPTHWSASYGITYNSLYADWLGLGLACANWLDNMQDSAFVDLIPSHPILSCNTVCDICSTVKRRGKSKTHSMWDTQNVHDAASPKPEKPADGLWMPPARIQNGCKRITIGRQSLGSQCNVLECGYIF
ncbi:hypothetical protein B0H16DRAFT_1455065 [Mycena metata]|uniref:Uncharacterized protein n=1 Tax=Mycena metata TaxID=1033252 RepID=A0AAD7NIT4_9AGAR|nr:hypothetical protein B0H16DRAFT_1455065 [Mycena metata]